MAAVTKTYRFRGWDYEELAECWGIDLPEGDDQRIEAIRDFIVQRWAHEHPDYKRVVSDVRRFVRALRREEIGFHGPLWDGLLKIRDDFTFLQATTVLLPLMWT